MLDIVERWEKTRLLEGVQKELRAYTAYLMNNQIGINEGLAEDKRPMWRFRRISVPLLRRVFPCLESHKKYNVESKLNLESCLNKEFGLGKYSSLLYEDQYDGHGDASLAKEAELTANLAEHLKSLLDRFIESQNPFHTFYVQGIAIKDDKLVLYYDLD